MKEEVACKVILDLEFAWKDTTAGCGYLLLILRKVGMSRKIVTITKAASKKLIKKHKVTLREQETMTWNRLHALVWWNGPRINQTISPQLPPSRKLKLNETYCKGN